MTTSANPPREQYATDGITTTFTIHFQFFEDTDVNAIFADSAGGVTTLALSTDYTVSGGNGAGGTLTTTNVLAAGGTLTTFREIPFTQESDYVEDDPFPPETVESDFDRAAMRDQQLQDATERSLTFPVTIPDGVSAELPLPAADQILGWNGTGTALENKNLPAGTTVYSSIANTQLGTATGEAVTPDGLSSLWQQGADIATATTLVKPSDPNLGGYYRLTGNTNVSAGWAGEKAGRTAKFLVVTGGFTLVNGVSWKNKSSADIVTVPGDTFEMIAEAANVWRMLSYQKADGTALVATVVNTAASALYLSENFI